MSLQTNIIVISVLIFIVVFLLYLLIKLLQKSKDLEKKVSVFKEKYEPILNIEAEINDKNEELSNLDKKLQENQLNYSEKLTLYKKLSAQVELYEQDLNMIEMGAFTPEFRFDTPESYKEAITAIVQEQRDMVKDKTAITAAQNWVVNGSEAEGKKFTNQALKLALRAFNNEANTIIKNVTWRNYDTSKKRIEKAFDDINKFNTSNQIEIAFDYFRLKRDELTLTYEYQLKLQEQKEEQAEAKRAIREEEKLERDRIKAEKEEYKYAKLLEKARQDAENKTGQELDALNEQIKQLSLQLDEAHKANERALSMAQQTKSGFVYIISNIGSFGENIYKIGMTRRLEPMDRVKELSGASVPFAFDTHAMIYSKDAPALEAQLHNNFSERRVNLANFRKEFFKVSLEEIEEAVESFGVEYEFFKNPEAEEYQKTLTMRKETLKKKEQEKEEFPDFI